jgi:hypothetical protein
MIAYLTHTYACTIFMLIRTIFSPPMPPKKVKIDHENEFIKVKIKKISIVINIKYIN